MIIGIDASNLSVGGGVTHLVELLAAADPQRHGFERLVVWAPARTLDRIAARPWLDLRRDPVLEAGFLRRAYWQRGALGRAARAARCDLLFVPGGSYATDFAPVVTMSRNLLPFEPREARRYGWSARTLKMQVLRWSQSRSFRRAAGVIFLSDYAQRTVRAVAGALRGATAVIPHGLDPRFRLAPRPQRDIAACDAQHPFRWLYVSTIDHYKHPWHVAQAVATLRAEGLPVELDFIGSSNPDALRRLTAVLDRVDPARRHLRYLGEVEYGRLHQYYARADAFVYASSCENLPNILIEAMAAGLPIACSDRGPMPEVLRDGGCYFDPEDDTAIAASLRRLVGDPALRAQLAHAAHDLAARYSWAECADRTFGFLAGVARNAAAPPGSGARGGAA